MTYTHLDGSTVVVTDPCGHRVPAVEVVRLEPGFAVVTVRRAARAWMQDLLARMPDVSFSGEVHSVANGQLCHEGAIRVVCV